ncbi:MAG: hypothetical protein AB1733_11030 [Thermodesulfobacteriota bacterium]
MRKMALILALLFLAAPISDVSARNYFGGVERTVAKKKLMKWEKQQEEFWKKFDADMARIDKDLAGPVKMNREPK